DESCEVGGMARVLGGDCAADGQRLLVLREEEEDGDDERSDEEDLERAAEGLQHIGGPCNMLAGAAAAPTAARCLPFGRAKAGGEGGIRTLGRTFKVLQRFSKPPPSASRPPHRR